MILPEEYQKNSKGDKKNVASAMKVILNNPDDCLFIIGKFLTFNNFEIFKIKILKNFDFSIECFFFEKSKFLGGK